jgi:hypothetical protein
MNRVPLRLALLVLTLIILTPPPTAHAQGLAALAVATGPGGGGDAAALVEKAGCWNCTEAGQVYNCTGGHTVGYWNCSLSLTGCNRSSPGCGGSASIPVDLDGAAQYVSRGAFSPQLTGTGPAVPGEERNCDGVVVARHQSPDNIASVRTRTAVLSL